MKLLLIRHAPAVASGTSGLADGERPLTTDGEAAFRTAAGGLAWIIAPPDVLLTSPLLRARATAAIAAHAFGRVEPRIESTLAHGTPETVLTALANHGLTVRTIAVVGHEPLLSAVLARLMGISDSDRIAFEKGGRRADGSARWPLGPRTARLVSRAEHSQNARGQTRQRDRGSDAGTDSDGGAWRRTRPRCPGRRAGCS